MNTFKKTFLLSACFLTVFSLLLSPVLYSETGENKDLKAMITELEKKLSEADKKMIAHPSFIQEMRALIEKYKAKLRDVFFYDNFSDKNYTQNPQWIKKSGSFFVNTADRLSSSVIASQPQPQQQPQTKSLEQEAIGLVLDGLFGKPKETTSPAEPPPAATPAQTAAIYTKTTIPPDFEIDIEFISKSKWGEMEIVLLGSKSLIPRYRLSYKVGGSAERPIEIIRERNGRKFIIEAATQYPQLDDGKPHQLKWIRFQNGAMQVIIDGKEILRTYEVYFRDNFTGLELVNKGGTYEWASVKILKALKSDQN